MCVSHGAKAFFRSLLVMRVSPGKTHRVETELGEISAPILVLGLVLIVVAFQFISLGLIAELIVAGRRPEEACRIARRV